MGNNNVRRYLTSRVLYSSGTIRMLETSYFAASTDYQSKRSGGKDNSILACPGKGRSSEMSKTTHSLVMNNSF